MNNLYVFLIPFNLKIYYYIRIYLIKNKVLKEHLENYYNYLFIQANDFINKYEEKTK